MKAIIIEGDLRFQNSFKEFNGTVGLQSATEQQWYAWGFREVVNPTLTEYQTTGEPYLDTINDVITYAIVEVTPPTSLELYDALKQEGNTMFDDLRRKLSEVSSPYSIFGETHQDLKNLTTTIQDTREVMFAELDLDLENDNHTGLKNFTYETAEIAELRESIETFASISTVQLDNTSKDYASIASTATGLNLLHSLPTGSYTSTFMKYSLSKGTNSRAGEFITNWNSASSLEYTDISTRDIGNTSDLVLSSSIISGNIHINVNSATSGWKLNTLLTFI